MGEVQLCLVLTLNIKLAKLFIESIVGQLQLYLPCPVMPLASWWVDFQLHFFGFCFSMKCVRAGGPLGLAFQRTNVWGRKLWMETGFVERSWILESTEMKKVKWTRNLASAIENIFHHLFSHLSRLDSMFFWIVSSVTWFRKVLKTNVITQVVQFSAILKSMIF